MQIPPLNKLHWNKTFNWHEAKFHHLVGKVPTRLLWIPGAVTGKSHFTLLCVTCEAGGWILVMGY